ncbi:unnamed protein product, partial [Trichobilharzia regenti]
PTSGGHTSPLANLVDEFSFTVLVLPGQDPGLVHIGWVTSYFKLTKTNPADYLSGFPHPSSASSLSPHSQGHYDTAPGQPHGLSSHQHSMLGDTSSG